MSKRFLDVKINKNQKKQSRHIVEIKLSKKNSKQPRFFGPWKKSIIRYFINSVKSLNSEKNEEEVKRYLMWSGVVFFMVLMFFLWSLGFRASMRQYSVKSEKDIDINNITRDFIKNFQELQAEFKDIQLEKEENKKKNEESLGQQQINIDDLKIKLEEVIREKYASSSQASTTN